MFDNKLQISTEKIKNAVCKNFQSTNHKLRFDYGDNSYNNKEQLVEWREKPIQPGVWQTDDVVFFDE